MAHDHDDWLAGELRRGFEDLEAPNPHTPRYANQAFRAKGLPKMDSFGSTARSKVATVATIVALTASGGVAAKAAITGDANPLHWGQQVKQQVQTCKDELAPGEHGIGQCVSAFASQHGQAQRAAHSQAGEHGKPDGQPGQGDEHGKPEDHPGQGSGKPEDTPGSDGSSSEHPTPEASSEPSADESTASAAVPSVEASPEATASD